MARNIPAEALAKIAQTKGLEPINVIQVQWTLGGQYLSYGDRYINELPFIQNKLQSLAGLEAVVDVTNTGTSTSVAVTLDDTDGSIKSIFDINDIHGRNVKIVQWFTELPWGSRFLIFEGMIASAIEWSEGERTLKFDVMTRIDDVQAGFTIEDGQFTDIPRLLLGQAWPVVFGTVLDMPALRMDEAPTGTTRIDIGIPDNNTHRQGVYHNSAANEQLGKGMCLSLRGAELMFQGLFQGGGRDAYTRGQALQRQAQQMQASGNAQYFQGQRFIKINEDQTKYDVAVIPIINGHRFIQNTDIVININGAMYAGHFTGDNFAVSSRQAPEEPTPKKPKSKEPDNESKIPSVVVQGTQEYADSFIANLLFGGPLLELPSIDPFDKPAAYWACDFPYFFTLGSPDDEQKNKVGEQKEDKNFFAPAGTGVSVGNHYPTRYILSIIPGTQVLWLSAKRTMNGLKIITPIPPKYYTVGTLVLGSITAVIATFHQPMSTLKTVNNDLDWEDEIYATLTSPIGPNVVDEMIYIIQRWTTYGIDFDSFNHVRTRLALYPGNWALLEKKNVVQLLKDIAFQSRCAIWLADGTFHLRYLPEQGTPVDTLTENDIEQQTLVVSTTATEDLTTRYIATWRQSYGTTTPNKLILQYNIPKYGVHEETTDYFIYNTEALVAKSAIYWLIRKSNVWKTLKCKTFLTKLKIETLDNVNVNLAHNFTHYGNAIGSVTKATFNSDDFSIDLEIWLPVRLGEMTVYPFACPADLSLQEVWPTNEDVAGNFTGSSTDSNTAQGSLGGSKDSNIPSLKPLTPGTGKEGQIAPSDQHEVANPPPIIEETTDEIDPAYLESLGDIEFDLTGLPVGVYANTPHYDAANRHISAPSVTPEQPPQPRSYPGYLESKVESSGGSSYIYNAKIFPEGLGAEPLTVKVIVLDINPQETIPPNTWGVICMQVEKDSKGDPLYHYYFQPPIWL